MNHPLKFSANVVLVGSGGFAEELLFWGGDQLVRRVKGYVGFESTDLSARFPYLGEIDKFEIDHATAYLIAIGNPVYRTKAALRILEHGGMLDTFIHPTAQIADDCELEEGVVIGPFCLVSTKVRLGRCVFMNNYSSVGHHASIGEFTILHPYAAVLGFCRIGEYASLGVQCSILPKVQVGGRARIAPGSSVYRNVKPGALVMGVPAKTVEGM